MKSLPDVIHSNGVGVGPESSGYHGKYLLDTHVRENYVSRTAVLSLLESLDDESPFGQLLQVEAIETVLQEMGL